MTPKLLFIGGSPRSGTTLLKNLLEHPKHIAQFPMEQSVLKSYFSGRYNLFEDYYRTNFINEREEGQQTILSNKGHYESYRARMIEEFKVDFCLDVDHSKFKNYYLEYLGSQNIINARTIHLALIHALGNSNAHTGSSLKSAEYYLFKKPNSTVFFAQEYFKLDPTAKFIHILRHPFHNYASQKSRRLTKWELSKGNKKIGKREYQKDWITGYLLKPIFSLSQAQRNQEIIGPKNYFIVRYEDLVQEPIKWLTLICDFLEVPFDNNFLKPTVMGNSQQAGSHYLKNSEVLKPRPINLQHFMEITSHSERNLIKKRLRNSAFEQYYDVQDLENASHVSFWKNWIKPFKHEAELLYIWRLFHYGENKISASAFQKDVYDYFSTIYLDPSSSIH